MLTDKQLRAAKANGKTQYLHDGGGLYLRVTPAGYKTFILRVRRLSKYSWLALGPYPDMSLAEAREKAVEVNTQGAPAQMTVAQAAEQYMQYVKKHYKRPDLIEDRLTRDVIATIGAKKLHSVTKRDISEVLQAIVDRGSPVQANRTLADIKHLFAYCTEKGWVSSDPTQGITRKYVGGREKPKKRNLSWDEIKEFIHVLYTRRFDEQTKIALGLLLVTGQRPSEVIGIHAAEIRGVWWTIPKERIKTGRLEDAEDHKVYLSPQARQLIKRWTKPDYDHRTLDRAVSRIGMGFTPHDLRRTMASRLGDLGVMPHVTEKMLNHKMEGVMAVYNHAEYLPERRSAWRLWGIHLARIRREVLREIRQTRHASA